MVFQYLLKFREKMFEEFHVLVGKDKYRVLFYSTIFLFATFMHFKTSSVLPAQSCSKALIKVKPSILHKQIQERGRNTTNSKCL